MTKPAFVRYLPARLKPLGRPAVWAPLAVVALLGAIVLEYRQNPDWFNRQPVTTLTPESSLTSEEAARLSEVGTLDVLLNGARVPEDTEVVTSQINPDAPVSDELASAEETEEPMSSAEAIARSVSEDYPIPGAPSVATTSPSTAPSTQPGTFSGTTGLLGPSSDSSATSRGETTFNFGDGLVNPAAPSTNSALADAVNRREAQLAAEQAASGGGTSDEGPSEINSVRGTSRLPTTSVVPAAPVPGAFTRTTSEMSPPPGTTGYQVPGTARLPGYNLPPAVPTRNPLDTANPGVSNTLNGGGRSLTVPAPANVAPPVVDAPGATTNSGRLYTAPSSVQPEQDPIINPRRF